VCGLIIPGTVFSCINTYIYIKYYVKTPQINIQLYRLSQNPVLRKSAASAQIGRIYANYNLTLNRPAT